MTARRRQTSRGWRAYAVREVAEVAVLVAVLAIVAAFAEVPVWLLVGLPLVKAIASVMYYVLFLRRAFRRPFRVPITATPENTESSPTAFMEMRP